MILCIRRYNRGWEVLLIDRIRVKLGFQAESVTIAISNSAFSGLCSDKVACIKLYAAALRISIHRNTARITLGLRHLAHRARLIGEHIVVIISASKMKLLKIRIDILSDWLHSREIHRSSCNRSNLSGRDGMRILIRRICIRKKLQLLIKHHTTVVSCQIEITVVRKIHYSVCVCLCMICDMYSIFIIERVSYCNMHVSRESLLLLRAVMVECNVIVATLLHLPHQMIESVFTTVQTVVILVGLNYPFLTINRKTCPLDTVSVSADCCTEAARSLLIRSCVIITKHHILHDTVFICKKHRHQCCSKIGNLHYRMIFIF